MSLFPTTPTLYGEEGVPITTPTYNSYTPEEMKANGLYVLWYMFSKGWSYEACCGIVGNMIEESRVIPTNRERIFSGGVWTGEYGQGLGLIQWTPFSRVATFLTDRGYNYEILSENMEGQCEQLWYELDPSQSDASVWHTPVYYQPQYVLTREQFKVVDDVAIAAGAFVTMRERPYTMGSSGSAEAAELTVLQRIARANTAKSWFDPYYVDGKLTINYGDFPAWFIAALCRKREEGGILAR